MQKEPFKYPFSKQDSIEQRLDPLGERDVFYESEQQLAINRRILTMTKDEATIAQAAAKPRGFPLSDLIHAYLDHDQSYSPAVSKIINYYIPDFGRLNVQCNAVYRQLMMSSYAKTELKSYYNEKCEMLYHFIVTVVMILTQQAKHGLADRDQMDFLTMFNRVFPPDRLPISGLYRPFYMGLNSSTPEDKRFSEVIPYLPPVSLMNLTKSNYQLAFMPLFSIVPNFAGLLRVIHQQNTYTKKTPPKDYHISMYDNDNNLWGNDFLFEYPDGLTPDDWSDNRMLTWRRWTPGFLNQAPRVASLGDLVDYSRNELFPRPSYVNITEDINNEFEWMGFSKGFNWFENLITQQNRVCRYWPESTTLDHLIKPSCGYGLHVSRIREPSPKDIFDAYDRTHQPPDLNKIIAETDAMLTKFDAIQIQDTQAARQALDAIKEPYHLKREALRTAESYPPSNDEHAIFDVVDHIRKHNVMEPALLRTDMYQEIRELTLHDEIQAGAQITNWHTENYISHLSQKRGVIHPHDIHLFSGSYWDIICKHRSSSFQLGPRIHSVPSRPDAFTMKPTDPKTN